MRKIYFIFSILFSATFVANAQNYDLETSVDQLAAYAKNEFSELKGKEVSHVSDKDKITVTWESKLCVNRAVANQIIALQSAKDTTVYFKSVLGTYKTRDVVVAKMHDIQTTLEGKGFKLKEYDVFLSDSKGFTLTREYPEKIALYNCEFTYDLNSKTGSFELIFKLYAKNAITEYTLITIEPSNEIICKDIRRIVADAENDFESFEGAKIKSGDNTYAAVLDAINSKYRSTLQLAGSLDCYLEKDLTGTVFVVETARDLSDQDTQRQLENVFRIVGFSLGKGYAYRLVNANATIEFVVLNNLDYSHGFIKVALLEAIKSDKGFNVSIKFKSGNKIFN